MRTSRLVILQIEIMASKLAVSSKNNSQETSNKKGDDPSISPTSVPFWYDFEVLKHGCFDEFRLLLTSKYKLKVINDDSQTALHYIFYRQRYDFFDALDQEFSRYPIESYNNVNVVDSKGLSHLHIACARGSLRLVERYLYRNEHIDVCYKGDDPVENFKGFTALHFAITNPTNHKVDIVKILIEYGVNVNATDFKGRTPLHIASRFFDKEKKNKSDKIMNLLEVMDVLIKNGSDIETKDPNGNTPLLSVFSLLYKEFEKESPIDQFYSTHHISEYMPMVKKKFKFFLQNAADVAATNNNNQNVLHLILRNLKVYRFQFEKAEYIFDDSDHLDMIKQVLDAKSNIDINLKNYKGQTPLQMAVSCMSSRIVGLLLDHSANLESLTFEVEDRKIPFFCYPDIDITLETVQDLTAMLDTLFSRGFKLSLQDNVAILDLLQHDASRFCQCNRSSYCNIKLALHYSNKNHLEAVLTKVENNLHCKTTCHLDDVLYDHDSLYNATNLHSYLIKFLYAIHYGKVYIHKDVVVRIKRITRRYFDFHGESLIDLEKLVLKELNKLKSIKLTNKISLHDILMQNPERIPRSIVDSFDTKLIENLNYYKDMVKGHITKARVRHLFKKYSSDYLKLVCHLPDVCCWMIVHYLSNEDILNLSLATVIIRH